MSERRTRRSQFSIGFDTKDVPGKIVEYRVVFETWEHQDRGFEQKSFKLLEPNHPDDSLAGILFLDVQTSGNKGGGFLLYLDNLNSTSAPIDVTIDNYVSGREQITLQSHGPATIPGVVRLVSRK